MTRTYGPAFDQRIDGRRINTQLIRIRDFSLNSPLWYSLSELAGILGYPESSISAQLRHLRKEQFGSFDVRKRRRNDAAQTWEYKVFANPIQRELFTGTSHHITPNH